MKIRDLRCDSVTFDMALKIAGFGVYLEWLNIGPRGLSDMSMIKIVEGCPNLKHIDMFSVNITDLSINRIADCCRHMKSCPHLNVLSLSSCTDVTDAGIIRIAEGCPNLKRLMLLSCSNITDTGLMRIAECCPSLERGNIKDCVFFCLI
jgi:hypothetical protein